MPLDASKSSLVAPHLPAGRYHLREFCNDDVDLIYRAGLDPLIPLITTVPLVPSREQAIAFIQRQHQRLHEQTGYSLAIADAETNQAVGQIGLWLQQQSNGIASIGYWVDPQRRGEGIATLALSAISFWGLQLPGIHRLELYVEPWNTASWHAAESCGYQREGLLRSWREIGSERRDLFMYSLLATDLPAAI